jgi:hypothetical protein
MIPEDKCMRRFGLYETKNLRRFAIKAFPELNIGWNRIFPPIVFHPAVGPDVAHAENFPEA